MFLDLNLASTQSLHTGELIALPVTFIILLLVFRSLVAAALPVIVATLGVVCTLGIMDLLATSMHLPITFFVPNLVTMIGLGVGIDYCLIYLARYRRERANHLTPQEAMQISRKTAGKTVLASALLVMSGFLTLLLIPLEFFTSIAVGGMLVVAFVALATLTLLPAMIFLVGVNLEWGSALLRPFQNLQVAPGVESCEKWGRAWWWAAPGIAALASALTHSRSFGHSRPFWLQVASVEAKNIPAQSDSRRGYDSLSKNLGAGWMMPTIILVQHPSADWARLIRRLFMAQKKRASGRCNCPSFEKFSEHREGGDRDR